MPKLTAFVARSFLECDEPKIKQITDHLDTLSPLGFLWYSAEPAESERVSEKVQKLIKDQDICIGILTARHAIYVDRPSFADALKFWRGKLPPKAFSAPPWVLQECAFALASGKHLVLYVEPGVEHGGLQGDLEYIPYPYPDSASSLLKTNEMINRLIAEKSGISVETVVKQEAKSSVTQEEKGQPTEPLEIAAAQDESALHPVGEFRKHLWELLDALSSGDAAAAESAFEKGMVLVKKGAGAAFTEAEWAAFYQYKRFSNGEDGSVDALRRLTKEFPDDPYPPLYLGHCFRSYGEFDEAVKHFERAKVLFKEADASAAILAIADCLIGLKRSAEAENLLVENIELGRPAAVRMLEKLYSILKEDASRIFEAFGIAEYSLQGDPTQKQFRFSLGLDYHKAQYYSFFLHHFKLISEHEPDNFDAIHNLALAYDLSKFPISSVESYKRAVEGGVWLSGANLGQLYLAAGMADEAEEIIKEISGKAEAPPPEIGRLLSDIGEQRKAELEAIHKVEQSIVGEKQFFAALGTAYLDKSPCDVNGIWEFSFGPISIEVLSTKIHGEAKFERDLTGLAALALLGSRETTKTTTSIKLSGMLKNHSARITVTTSESAAPLLGLAGNEQVLYLAFSPDCKTAQAAEIKDAKIVKIRTLNKRHAEVLSPE